MDSETTVNVHTRADLRAWLEVHAATEPYCWIITNRSGEVQYLDIVEEALCFGWIDGTKKKLSDTESMQRISPRRKNSHWTELNKERARRLIKLGLMKESGLKVLPNLNPAAFTIDPLIEARLKADPQVYQNFLNFPPLYQRIRIDNVQSYKKDPELFNRRLDKFIKNTKENRMYGQWHDNGRLLED